MEYLEEDQWGMSESDDEWMEMMKWVCKNHRREQLYF